MRAELRVGPQVAGPQDGSAATLTVVSDRTDARASVRVATVVREGLALGVPRLFTGSNPWQEANQTWESLRG
jgi:hypothetical protein